MSGKGKRGGSSGYRFLRRLGWGEKSQRGGDDEFENGRFGQDADLEQPPRGAALALSTR